MANADKCSDQSGHTEKLVNDPESVEYLDLPIEFLCSLV